MSRHGSICLFSMIAAFAIAVQAAVAAPLSMPDPAVPCYAKFEAAFTLNVQTGNPFDPVDNDVIVLFTAPDRNVICVPAFWDGDTWRVRFTPVQPGVYTWAAMSNNIPVRPITAAPDRFRCVKSENCGFVRRDPRIAQRFVFDDGRTYYPYGINVGWLSSDRRHGLLPEQLKDDDYPAFFARMHGSGMNWARVWMTFWAGQELDWSNDTGKSLPLGSMSLDAARAWDRIIDSAVANGMYVQMTMQFHGQLMTARDWGKNPYNIANGGILHSASDFFTDPRAITITKKRYRYIVARWGYSPNLLAFELFNEVQFSDPAKTNFSDIVEWHRTMAAYIRSIDPYHHLVTTSSIENPENAALASIGLDFDQLHIYCPFPSTIFSQLPGGSARPPVFAGEWGPEPDSAYEIREGLWAGIMAPTAGAAQYWYWDRLTPNGLWPAFQSAGRFIGEGRLADLGEMHAISVVAQSANPPGDLRFWPPASWTPDASNEVTLLANGDIVGLGAMTRYLRSASSERKQDRRYIFHLNMASPGALSIKFVQVANTGAHPVLRVENSPVATAEHDYPSNGGDRHGWTEIADTLTIEVPAGSQEVTVSNAGSGWLRTSEIRVTHCADPIRACAKGNRHAAAFRAALASEDVSSPIIRGHIAIRHLDKGEYKIRLWDIDAGKWLQDQFASTVDGALNIPLPALNQVAGVVVKRNPSKP